MPTPYPLLWAGRLLLSVTGRVAHRWSRLGPAGRLGAVLCLGALACPAAAHASRPPGATRPPVVGAQGLATSGVAPLAKAAPPEVVSPEDPNARLVLERDQVQPYRNLKDVREALDARRNASLERDEAAGRATEAQGALWSAAVARSVAVAEAERTHRLVQTAAVVGYTRARPDDAFSRLLAGEPIGSVDTTTPHLYEAVLAHLKDQDVKAAARRQDADLAVAQAEAEAQSAANHLGTAEARLARAERGVMQAVQGVVGDDSAPTILGAPVLTAEDLARYLREQGHQIAAAAEIDDLARWYIDEGKAEGVRGDIAFAQAVIETGHFTAIAGTGAGNNFAGIGACDGCGVGYGFDSAQLGVRAQIQLLRTYATPTLTAADLANPSVIDPPENQSARGCCTTWADLTGVWASAQHYDVAVMNVYANMLASAAAARGL